MSNLTLIAHQFRFDQKAFWRNPASVFFTVVLPLIFLIIFGTVFGNDTVKNHGGMKMSSYYVAGIMALTLVSATFVNLAMSLTILRERGVLKRLRGTPLPVWIFVFSRILVSVVITLLLAVVILLAGIVLYGVDVPTHTLPGLIVTLIFGAVAFCSLGIAFSALIPSEDASPAITNAVVLPLYFISGVFFDVEDSPRWLTDLAGIFPVRHVALSALAAFDPTTEGSALRTNDLAVIVIWGVIGVILALLFFRWTPRS